MMITINNFNKNYLMKQNGRKGQEVSTLNTSINLLNDDSSFYLATSTNLYLHCNVQMNLGSDFQMENALQFRKHSAVAAAPVFCMSHLELLFSKHHFFFADKKRGKIF